VIKTLLNNRLYSIFVILLLTLAAYSNIFPNEFVLDDFDFIVDWPLIQDWKNLPQFFLGYTPPSGQEGIFSPFKTLVHAINYHLFGLNPFGHHVFSIFVHLAAVYFVYQLSFHFTKNRTATFLSTLFFGLHPVHAGVVGNMTGSVDVLGIVFLFISFYYYVRAQEKASLIHRKYYVYSLFAAFGAIFIHELCLSLPILFIWYSFCFMRKEVHWKRILFRTAPFFGIAIFYVLCKFLALNTITRGEYIYDSFYLTMLVMIKAWAKYVYINFLPITLTHNHVIVQGIFSFDPDDFDRFAVLSQSFLEVKTFLSSIFLGGIFYIAWKFREKQPLLTFCIGWFFISLLPGANIIPSGIYFAERYLYPGSWAFCLLLGVYSNKFLEYGREIRRDKILFWSGIISIMLIASCYFVRTWIRSMDLRDQITLFESAVKANPRSALLRLDMGLIYTKYQLPEKAITSFNESINIKPNDPVVYFAIANTYLVLRQKQKAIQALQNAIIIDPVYPEAYYNLAGIYASLQMAEKAIQNLNISLKYLREQGRDQDAQEYEGAFRAYFGSL